MKMTGVNCIRCGYTLIDNGVVCNQCGQPKTPEQLAVQEMHAADKRHMVAALVTEPGLTEDQVAQRIQFDLAELATRYHGLDREPWVTRMVQLR